MTDGGAGRDALPSFHGPRFDEERGHALPEGDPFLQDDTIERDGRGELQRERRRPRGIRRPVRVERRVEHGRCRRVGSAARRRDRRSGGEIGPVGGVERRAESRKRGQVGRRHEAAAIGRHVQQQRAVAPDGLLVDLEQPRRRLHLRVLGLPVEPPGTNRDIALGGHPVLAEARAFAQLVAQRRAGRVPVPIDGRPHGQRRLASLVADPAHVGPGITENDGLRLQLPHRREEDRPVVILPPSVRPFPVRAVEPHLEDRTVAVQAPPRAC